MKVVWDRQMRTRFKPKHLGYGPWDLNLNIHTFMTVDGHKGVMFNY